MADVFLKRFSWIALIKKKDTDVMKFLLSIRNWNLFYFINKSKNNAWPDIEEFLDEVAETTGLDRECLAQSPVKIHRFYLETFARTEGQMGHYHLKLADFFLPETKLAELKESDTLRWFARQDIDRKKTHDGKPIVEAVSNYLDILGYTD